MGVTWVFLAWTSLLRITSAGQLFYCTTVTENFSSIDALEQEPLESQESSNNVTKSTPDDEVIRFDDCNAAMLIKPLDRGTEQLISKCIELGVLKVKFVPFIVVGNYELPDDRFPAMFANEKPNNSKEPFEFTVHWFAGDEDDDYDYADRGLDKRVTPLQVAVNLMRRGFREAQKVAGQIIKDVTRPNSPVSLLTNLALA